MRHLKGPALMVGAVIALLAAVSLSSAFAASPLPQLLPIEENKRFTDRNDGTTKLQWETASGTLIECRSVTSSGIQETDTLGNFHYSFEGCKFGAFKCTSAGDREEEILALGSFHYVYDTLGGSEKVAALLLFAPSTFECTAIERVELTGRLLCLVLRPLEETRTHLIHCIRGPGRGEQAETKWWNDNLETQTASLEISINGGARERISLLLLEEIRFQRANAFMND